MLERIKRLLFRQRRGIGICCFHFGRCGSTLLGNMLASRPDLDWKGEVFHGLHENNIPLQPHTNPFEFLDFHWKHSPNHHFGIETKFQHLDSNGLDIELGSFLSGLKNIGFRKIIILKRKNYLRQAISVARGQLTKNWHVSVDEKPPRLPTFELDLERISLGGRNRPILDCFEFLDSTFRQSRAIVEKSNLECLELLYEDDLEIDPLSGYAKVTGFINLPHSDTTVSVRKIENRPVNEIVTNFQEIRQRLKNTTYEWMCDN